MIRLISLDSGTRPWLLVLVLTTHNRGGRSCQQSGRSLCHNTPNSDWLSDNWSWPPTIGAVRVAHNRGTHPDYSIPRQLLPPRYLNLTLSWSWPPTIGAVGVVSNRGAPYTVQMSNSNSLSNTWPWPCLGLDRPQSGRSELSAIGALLIPLQCLTVITSQIHEHDLVLVLTAHNRGGRSCQQPGRSLYRLKCLTVIHYNTWPWPCLGLDRPQSGRSKLPTTGALQFYSRTFVPFLLRNFVFLFILTMSARGGRRILWSLTPFLCIATHSFLPLGY